MTHPYACHDSSMMVKDGRCVCVCVCAGVCCASHGTTSCDVSHPVYPKSFSVAMIASDGVGSAWFWFWLYVPPYRLAPREFRNAHEVGGKKVVGRRLEAQHKGIVLNTRDTVICSNLVLAHWSVEPPHCTPSQEFRNAHELEIWNISLTEIMRMNALCLFFLVDGKPGTKIRSDLFWYWNTVKLKTKLTYWKTNLTDCLFKGFRSILRE